MLSIFHVIRGKSTIKPPSISEFLDWLKVLHIEELIKDKIDEKNIEYLPAYRKKAIQLSLYTLVKTKEDMDEVEELLKLK